MNTVFPFYNKEAAQLFPREQVADMRGLHCDRYVEVIPGLKVWTMLVLQHSHDNVFESPRVDRIYSDGGTPVTRHQAALLKGRLELSGLRHTAIVSEETTPGKMANVDSCERDSFFAPAQQIGYKHFHLAIPVIVSPDGEAPINAYWLINIQVEGMLYEAESDGLFEDGNHVDNLIELLDRIHDSGVEDEDSDEDLEDDDLENDDDR